MEYTYHLLWVLENKLLREQTKRPLHYSFDDYKEEDIRNTQHHLVSLMVQHPPPQLPPRTDLQRVEYTEKADLLSIDGGR